MTGATPRQRPYDPGQRPYDPDDTIRRLAAEAACIQEQWTRLIRLMRANAPRDLINEMVVHGVRVGQHLDALRGLRADLTALDRTYDAGVAAGLALAAQRGRPRRRASRQGQLPVMRAVKVLAPAAVLGTVARCLTGTRRIIATTATAAAAATAAVVITMQPAPYTSAAPRTAVVTMAPARVIRTAVAVPARARRQPRRHRAPATAATRPAPELRLPQAPRPSASPSAGLRVAPGSLLVPPSVTLSGGTGVMVLAAQGGPVTWQAVAPASVVLGVYGGTIPAGQDATVVIRLQESQTAAGSAVVFVDGRPVTVSWQAADPDPQPSGVTGGTGGPTA